MPQPLIAGLPPNLDLPDGYIVRFNALDPSTGAAVAGVKVNNVSIFATSLGATSIEDLGPFRLVPGPGA